MKKLQLLLVSIIFLTFPLSVFAEGEQVELKWINGPTDVELGENLATLKIKENFSYINKEDTITFNENIGNYINGTEIGSVFPYDPNESWFIVFEYDEVGNIEDDDSEKIDVDAILNSFRQGNEEYNKTLEEQGLPTTEIIGWDERPSFDKETNNLTWAMLFSTEGKESVNYNTRILTRNGYISAILVADSSELEGLKPVLKDVLEGLEINSGQKYADFDPSVDKVSGIGLAGLIAGGAGVVAAKKGLLAGAILLFKKFFSVFLQNSGYNLIFTDRACAVHPSISARRMMSSASRRKAFCVY
mgnify:CR=1 FL=1